MIFEETQSTLLAMHGDDNLKANVDDYLKPSAEHDRDQVCKNQLE